MTPERQLELLQDPELKELFFAGYQTGFDDGVEVGIGRVNEAIKKAQPFIAELEAELGPIAPAKPIY